jgi:hypothetical protein
LIRFGFHVVVSGIYNDVVWFFDFE